MAETIGSLVDKISIVELRRWHAEEAMLNPAAPEEVRHECALRLKIIDEQRADLMKELSGLWRQVLEHGKAPKVYRQLKMYNDARLRNASRTGAPPAAAPVLEKATGTDAVGIIDFDAHRARKRPTTRR